MINSSKPDRSLEDLTDNKIETEEDGLRLGALRMARWKHQNEQFRQQAGCTLEPSSGASSDVVCPEPKVWARVHKKLSAYAVSNGLEEPPAPLILAGWSYSSTEEKRARWEETMRWCQDHNCQQLIDSIDEFDWFKG